MTRYKSPRRIYLYGLIMPRCDKSLYIGKYVQRGTRNNRKYAMAYTIDRIDKYILSTTNVDNSNVDRVGTCKRETKVH